MGPNILCIIPPHIPSYFNAGHHLPLFLVASYLRKNNPDINVETLDAGALNITWKEVCDILSNKYDIIYCMFDYDGADTCERFVEYKMNLSPKSKLVAFGRLVKEIPQFFIKRGYQAAHVLGDYECGAQNYLNYYLGNSETHDGVVSDTISLSSKKIDYLEPREWCLPDVREIPYYSYLDLYKNDLNKFCGIPTKMELVVPIARGCPVGCHFCDVPKMQGRSERRLSVKETLAYIEDSYSKLPFDYFTFYAPTFTLDKKWVEEFCIEIGNRNLKYKWKCVTVLKSLSEPILRMMAKAGCFRVSFGIETFNVDSSTALPRIKRDTWGHFNQIVTIANYLSVEINCFLILGMEGDNSEVMQKTMDECIKMGVRIRPTIYTPYERLHDEMSLLEVSRFNRQLFLSDLLPVDEAEKYYKLFYKNDSDRPSLVALKLEKSA